MKLIQSVTVGSGGAANIEFTSIPQSYTDLKLVFSLRGSNAVTFAGLNMAINNSTADMTTRYVYGSGSSASSGTLGGSGFMHDVNGSSSTSNTFCNVEYYFPNYTSAAVKTFSQDVVNENNATAAYMMSQAGLWNQTAAITTLKLTPSTGTWLQYSSASLYGILKGSLAGVTIS